MRAYERSISNFSASLGSLTLPAASVSVTVIECSTCSAIAPQLRPKSRQRAERGIHRRALGRSRGGFSSKLHCLADARGRPLAFHLTVGEAADCKTYYILISLTEQAPQALLADKGYDPDAIRDDLASRKIKPVLHCRANRRVKIEYDRTLYKQRNVNRTDVWQTENQPRHCYSIGPTRRELHQHGSYCYRMILAQIRLRRLTFPSRRFDAKPERSLYRLSPTVIAKRLVD
ncbi:transposase [Brucella intermedia]|nr:transposase [Brucella intermedia]KAB2720555.1 transposase [Brucella intermedia]